MDQLIGIIILVGFMYLFLRGIARAFTRNGILFLILLFLLPPALMIWVMVEAFTTGPV